MAPPDPRYLKRLEDAARDAETAAKDAFEAYSDLGVKLSTVIADRTRGESELADVSAARAEQEAAAAASTEKYIQQNRAVLKLLQEREKAGETLTAAEQHHLDTLEDTIHSQKLYAAAMKAAAKESAKQAKQQEDLANSADKFATSIFGINTKFDDFVEKLKKTDKPLEALKDGFFRNVNAVNMLGSASDGAFTAAFAATMKLALAQDEAIAGFRSATGAGKEFNQTIVDIERSNFRSGVTAQKSAAAVQSLFSTYRDFTNLSEGERKNIGETVALMAELGVSSDTSAQLLDSATKSLGMNVEQGNQLLLDLAGTAKSIGKPMAEVAADFASVAPKLAFYGENMIGVFKRLEMQSKATGLSVDQILGVVGEGFDTFEGAGKKVGQLNAILGGPYLNSIDMLNASEEERLEMIKASIEASGVQFDQLNKFEQKAFASALGTDVDTLRRSMGALTEEEELQAIQQEELADLAAETKTVMDQLKHAMMGLAVDARPLIESVSGLVLGFGKFMAMGDGLVGKVVLIGAGIISLGIKVMKFMQLMKALDISIRVMMASNPVTVWIVGITIAITALYAHWKNMEKAGYSTGDMLKDLGMKIVSFASMALGPWGLLIPLVMSFFGHLKDGKSITDALIESIKDLANNLTFGLAGKIFGFGTNIERKQQDKMKVTAVDDAIITSRGDIVRVNPNDNIIAAKPGGPILSQMMTHKKDAPITPGAGGFGGGLRDKLDNSLVGRGLLGAFDFYTAPLKMMANLIPKAIAAAVGPAIKESVTDPIVAALGDGTGNPEINVIVKIGERELTDQLIRAINSQQGRSAMSPFASS